MTASQSSELGGALRATAWPPKNEVTTRLVARIVPGDPRSPDPSARSLRAHCGTLAQPISWVETVSEEGRPPAATALLLPASCAAGELSAWFFVLGLAGQGTVIVPEAVMIASAAVLMRPLPPPVAFVNLPVPPTIVWVICRNSGVFVPAA